MEKAIQEKSLLTVWFKQASGTLWYMMADTGTRVQMPFFMMLFFFFPKTHSFLNLCFTYFLLPRIEFNLRQRDVICQLQLYAFVPCHKNS